MRNTTPDGQTSYPSLIVSPAAGDKLASRHCSFLLQQVTKLASRHCLFLLQQVTKRVPSLLVPYVPLSQYSI
jgi:hypothetical protein